MRKELSLLIESKNLVLVTGLDDQSTEWLVGEFAQGADKLVIEDAHQLATTDVLKRSREGLMNKQKVFLTANFRSQIPVINIAALCNELRKSIVNIDLAGWDSENAMPLSFSSF